MTFSGLQNKLVKMTALKLAKGRKLTPSHTAEAHKIVLAAIERVWQNQIDLDPAFDQT